MSIEDLKMYDGAMDLAVKNANLIDLVYGYCEGRIGEECKTDVLLEVMEVIKNNQSELIDEIDNGCSKLGKLLVKHGLL